MSIANVALDDLVEGVVGGARLQLGLDFAGSDDNWTSDGVLNGLDALVHRVNGQNLPPGGRLHQDLGAVPRDIHVLNVPMLADAGLNYSILR